MRKMMKTKQKFYKRLVGLGALSICIVLVCMPLTSAIGCSCDPGCGCDPNSWVYDGHWEIRHVDHKCEQPGYWDCFWHPDREYWIDGNGQWYWREYYEVFVIDWPELYSMSMIE